MAHWRGMLDALREQLYCDEWTSATEAGGMVHVEGFLDLDVELGGVVSWVRVQGRIKGSLVVGIELALDRESGDPQI